MYAKQVCVFVSNARRMKERSLIIAIAVYVDNVM